MNTGRPEVAIPKVVVLLATMIIVLAGCSGGGDAAEVGATEGGAVENNEQAGTGGGTPEKANVEVGLIPLITVAPVHIAVEDGLFEREGLNVEIETVTGGSQAIPAMLAGEIDFTLSGHGSTMFNSVNGLDMRAVAEANRAAPGNTEIIANDPALEDNPAGLEGKILALNTLNNIGEYATRAVVEQAGGDYSKVELREVPFPEMAPALERGEVDAIWASAPFNGIAKAQGGVVVSDSYVGRTEGLPIAGYVSTGNIVRNFPNTVRAFQRGLIAASDIARENPERVVEIVPTYTTLDSEAAERAVPPEYIADMDRSEIERVAELMLEFDMLPEAPDLDRMLIPTP